MTLDAGGGEYHQGPLLLLRDILNVRKRQPVLSGPRVCSRRQTWLYGCIRCEKPEGHNRRRHEAGSCPFLAGMTSGAWLEDARDFPPAALGSPCAVGELIQWASTVDLLDGICETRCPGGNSHTVVSAHRPMGSDAVSFGTSCRSGLTLAMFVFS